MHSFYIHGKAKLPPHIVLIAGFDVKAINIIKIN